MFAKPETFPTEPRPRHIRYFESLQIALVAITVLSQFAVAREGLLFNLLSLGPLDALLIGLTLAVSRGRKNWARWALLVIYALFISSTAAFVLLMPGVPLTAAVFAGVLTAAVPGAVLALAFTKQSSAWLHAKNFRDAVEPPIAGPIQQQPAARGGRKLSAKFYLGERPGLVWALSSGIGAGVGAAVACVAFPSARFAHNLIGHFSWALVGFASTVGLGFGAAQGATLAQLLKSAGGLQRTRIWLVAAAWMVASAVGVFAMIFPLWWTDAEALLMAPGYMLAVMAPGIGLLAALQWALIRSFSSLKGWLWRTAVGGAIAASMSLFAAMFVGSLLPVPMEAAWAGSFGLLIGAMQARPIRELKWNSGASDARIPAPPVVASA